MTEPIATVTDYLSLIAALRARVVELNINYDTLDALAGWTDGYASKVLAPEPRSKGKTLRALGPMAFDAALGALAVKLQVIPDPEQLCHIRRNRQFVPRERAPRMPNKAKHSYVVYRITAEHLRKMSRLSAAARMKKLSPAKRRAIARKAARARWARH